MTTDLLEINKVGILKDGKDTWLETFSGKRVSVLNPQPEEIDLSDVAHALSFQCRYNGHCSQFYSVAKHTVLGAGFMIKQNFPKKSVRAWLLHDATEAYVGDLIRPVKVQLEQFKNLEEIFAKIINAKYNILQDEKVLGDVYYVDNVMVSWEKRDLMTNSNRVWDGLPDISKLNLSKIKEEDPKISRLALKELFNEFI